MRALGLPNLPDLADLFSAKHFIGVSYVVSGYSFYIVFF